MRRKGISASRISLWLIPLAFLLVFYFYPLGRIIAVSFSQWVESGLTGWNWAIVRTAIGFTFFQAVLSTLLTVFLGIPAAFLFSRYRFRGKGLLRIISTLPFILPTVVVAAGFNALIGQKGWLNILLVQIFNLQQPPIQIQNTLAAILLAHVFYNLSIVIRVVASAWEQLDVRLENAARSLGAAPFRAFQEITLPLLLPSIISAVLLVFLFDFTSFGVILMMGGPQFTTLEVEIYIQTMQFLNLPLASLLSLIQLAFSMLITWLIVAKGRGMSMPVMPRVMQENLRIPVKRRERLFVFIMVSFLVVLLALPLIALISQSVLVPNANARNTGSGNWHLSFEYFQQLFINQRQSIFYVPPIEALRNSLVYALIASSLALALGGLLASATFKIKWLRKVIDWLVMLPLGTSAVTLGLGLFLAFSLGTSSLRWYPLLIPLAHALIALPFVLRLIEPALSSIPQNIKWAASSLGASPRKVWRYVELPIIWRAMTTALVYSFAISLGEFGATSFLTRPDIPTLPIAVYRYLNLPGSQNYGQAMAMAAILLMVCAGSMLLVDRLQIDTFTRNESKESVRNA